jgi:hypothetical protein
MACLTYSLSAQIGGGYKERDLSDITLFWMVVCRNCMGQVTSIQLMSPFRLGQYRKYDFNRYQIHVLSVTTQ